MLWIKHPLKFRFPGGYGWYKILFHRPKIDLQKNIRSRFLISQKFLSKASIIAVQTLLLTRDLHL